MRILTISNTPHHANQGSGYVITGYVEGLQARGHKVDAYGPEHFVTVKTRRAIRYLHPLMMARFGLQRVAEKKYDLVECYGAQSWLLTWILSKRSRDFILVHHSNGIESHRERMRQGAVESGLLPGRTWFQFDLTPLHEIGFSSVDTIVTVSDFDAAYVRSKQYVPSGRVYSIPNPLPENFLGQKFDVHRPRRVGYCGVWLENKGISVLSEDIPRFLRQYPKWTFSLVGVGEDFSLCAHFPEDVQDRIEVIPFLPRKELLEWYHSLAVLVCPSVYESFGLVQAEATACGVALVATKVGYSASLENREEVLHLPSSQSPYLLNALSELTENEGLRQRLARRGYEAVQDLRWKKAIDRLEAIYEELIHQPVVA